MSVVTCLSGGEEIRMKTEISKVTSHFHLQVLQMVEGDDEIKKLSQEKDSQEEALIEFNSALENILEKLIQENDNLDDFYGFMYDTDDDASISGKSSEHFDWDWPKKDSPCTELEWQDDFFHETKDLYVELKKEDQARGLESPNKRWLRMKSQRKADKDLLV
ncbi:hypothetical protein Tco_0436046 [Tanacetum coccineum]